MSVTHRTSVPTMAPADIFKMIPCPKRVSKVPLACRSQWLTWSPKARRVFGRLAAVIEDLEPPRLVHLTRNRTFNYTYSVAHTGLSDMPIARQVTALVAGLMGLSPPTGILFFSGLLDEHVTGLV